MIYSNNTRRTSRNISHLTYCTDNIACFYNAYTKLIRLRVEMDFLSGPYVFNYNTATTELVMLVETLAI